LQRQIANLDSKIILKIPKPLLMEDDVARFDEVSFLFQVFQIMKGDNIHISADIGDLKLLKNCAKFLGDYSKASAIFFSRGVGGIRGSSPS